MKATLETSATAASPDERSTIALRKGVDQPRCGRSWFARIASAVAGVAIALAIVEGIARGLPPPRYFALWQWDATLGHAPMPSQEMSIDWWVADGYPVTTYRTNGWGFRDREFVETKATDASRIMVIGDSFVEAVELDVSERFTELLEDQLNRLGRAVEVWNMGVGDYGTAQEYLLLKRYVQRVRPDLVVLMMFPLNDLINNGRRFAGDNESLADHVRPYFVVDRHGRLQRADRHPIRAFLRRHSLLFAHLECAAFAAQRRRLEQAGASQVELTRRRHVEQKEFPLLEYHSLTDEPLSGRWLEAWQVTDTLLADMQRMTGEVGAELLVVLLPCREEYDILALHDLAIRMRQVTGQRHRWRADRLSRRLVGLLGARGIRCVSLQRPFRRAFRQHGYGIERGGHFSSLGHNVIADELAPILGEQLTARRAKNVL